MDEEAARTVASLAVQRAREALQNSEVWARYMEEEGALILLPRNILDLGKVRAEEEAELEEEELEPA